MESVQNTTTTKKYIEVDGDTLVRLAGEAEIDEEFESGYLGQLNKRREEIDRQLKAEERAKRKKQKAQAKAAAEAQELGL